MKLRRLSRGCYETLDSRHTLTRINDRNTWMTYSLVTRKIAYFPTLRACRQALVTLYGIVAGQKEHP